MLVAILRDEGEAAGVARADGGVRHVAPVQNDLPAVGRDQPGEAGCQLALAVSLDARDAEDFAAAQAALGDQIQLRLGMELGDAEWDPAHVKTLLADAPDFDFVIGSVHLLSERFHGEDLYFFTPENAAQAQAAIEDYLNEALALAKQGGFNVLGHLTLPLRYFNEMRGLSASFDPYEEQIRVILKTLIENGRGIELNVNRGNTPLPDAKWLRLYRELGGELITLGTDAHTPAHAGRFIRERQGLLRECGFKRFCTFEKQRPIWHEL